MKVKVLAFIISCVLCFCGKVYACDCNVGTGGCIAGTVYDAQGTVGYKKVYLYKIPATIPRETWTDKNGCYKYDNLVSGLYVVTLKSYTCLSVSGEEYYIIQLQVSDKALFNDFVCK